MTSTRARRRARRSGERRAIPADRGRRRYLRAARARHRRAHQYDFRRLASRLRGPSSFASRAGHTGDARRVSPRARVRAGVRARVGARFARRRRASVALGRPRALRARLPAPPRAPLTRMTSCWPPPRARRPPRPPREGSRDARASTRRRPRWCASVRPPGRGPVHPARGRPRGRVPERDGGGGGGGGGARGRVRGDARGRHRALLHARRGARAEALEVLEALEAKLRADGEGPSGGAARRAGVLAEGGTRGEARGEEGDGGGCTDARGIDRRVFRHPTRRGALRRVPNVTPATNDIRLRAERRRPIRGARRDASGEPVGGGKGGGGGGGGRPQNAVGARGKRRECSSSARNHD